MRKRVKKQSRIGKKRVGASGDSDSSNDEWGSDSSSNSEGEEKHGNSDSSDFEGGFG